MSSSIPQDPSSTGERPPKRKWPRSQRFILSERGVDAEAAYRETIVASRASSGRAAFDEARSIWAREHDLQPDDGLYLGEVRGAAKSLDQVLAALRECDQSRPQAIEAMTRLLDLSFVLATVPELA